MQVMPPMLMMLLLPLLLMVVVLLVMFLSLRPRRVLLWCASLQLPRCVCACVDGDV